MNVLISEAKRSKLDSNELKLWNNYKKTGDLDVRNQLVLHYMPVLKKVALKVYKNNSSIESVDELVSEGMIALITAIDRFELDRDVKFETYVSYRVHGAMLDYINKQSGYVRKVRDIMKELTQAREALTSDLGREPEKQEIADYLGISVKELVNKMEIGHPVHLVSLDQTFTDNNSDEIFLELSTGDEENPINIIEGSGLSATLVNCICKLNKEQQLVLSLFYKEDLSIAEIADILNQDSKHISQVRFQAIKKLKKLLKS